MMARSVVTEWSAWQRSAFYETCYDCFYCGIDIIGMKGALIGVHVSARR